MKKTLIAAISLVCFALYGCHSKYSVAGMEFSGPNPDWEYPEKGLIVFNKNGRDVIFLGDTTFYSQEKEIVIIHNVSVYANYMQYSGEVPCTVYSDETGQLHLICRDLIYTDVHFLDNVQLAN